MGNIEQDVADAFAGAQIEPDLEKGHPVDGNQALGTRQGERPEPLAPPARQQKRPHDRVRSFPILGMMWLLEKS